MCTKEEMLKIAALLFCIKVNSDKNQLVMIPKLLKELVPTDQLKAMSENEWKKVGWLASISPYHRASFCLTNPLHFLFYYIHNKSLLSSFLTPASHRHLKRSLQFN